MRVLLSTIGSRGDVQPLVALALELKALAEEVRLCVPPDFQQWIEALGLPVTPIGPELRRLAAAPAPPAPTPPSPQRRRQMIEGTVATQFETIAAAAAGCDVIVGATALQVAAPSVAEQLGIPWVFVAYCPTVLPSPHHPPIPLGMLGESPAAASADNDALWDQDARRWNDSWGPPLNARRSALGLPAVDDVRSYIFTANPWLAADLTLAPWPDRDAELFQPGAWLLADERPLSAEIESFLDAGEPPVYFGFGSMRATHDLGRVMIESARALGRRAIVARGWAELAAIDDEQDCLTVGEVNQQVLFRRVAAVVHHGGAGTTTAAAGAGAPQVVVPQMYDQPYWAARVDTLGIGVALPRGAPTTGSLTPALARALHPEVGARAQSVAARVAGDGARAAAGRLAAGDWPGR